LKIEPEVKDRISKWQLLSQKWELTLPAVALDFATRGVHRIAIGVSSKQELKMNLDLLKIRVNPDI